MFSVSNFAALLPCQREPPAIITSQIVYNNFLKDEYEI